MGLENSERKWLVNVLALKVKWYLWCECRVAQAAQRMNFLIHLKKKRKSLTNVSAHLPGIYCALIIHPKWMMVEETTLNYKGLLPSTVHSGEKIEAISKLNRRRLVKWVMIWLYNGSVLSLKISCIKAYDDKESCLWYNGRLKKKKKQKTGSETIWVKCPFWNYNTGEHSLTLIQMRIEYLCICESWLPLLLRVQLFSPLTLSRTPPITPRWMAWDVPSPETSPFAVFLHHSSFSSQLKHHFPQIGVRTLLYILRGTWDEKDIFCTALWKLPMLSTK